MYSNTKKYGTVHFTAQSLAFCLLAGLFPHTMYLVEIHDGILSDRPPSQLSGNTRHTEKVTSFSFHSHVRYFNSVFWNVCHAILPVYQVLERKFVLAS
jgi:hypothetical protein